MSTTTGHDGAKQPQTNAPPTTSVGTTTPSSRSPLTRIAGFPPLIFAIMFVLVGIAAFTGTLPDSMLTGFAVTMMLGGLLIWVGSLIPVVRDFGLPTILCTFLPATLVFLGLVPENAITTVQSFIDPAGFLDFFVITIIAGSILGMPRALLVAAGPRFAVPVLGCLAITFLLIGLLGALLGFGFIEGILFIAAPIMAGGLGLGALPMSEMYASRLGGESADFMGDLMSAVVVANIVCILIAGVYNFLGKRRFEPFSGFNGYGQLLRSGRSAALQTPEKRVHATFVALGQGLAIAAVLFVVGQTLGFFLPLLHPFAWTIIAAALVKIFKLLPQHLEDASSDWGELFQIVLVPALLVGVSLTYISIDEVLASFASPTFLLMTVVTVLVATLSSGAIGWCMRFNFVEASITPGLVMADTGGSGDVSVLSAANRLHLMPFAALTNRVGGALVLFVTSLLVPLLGA